LCSYARAEQRVLSLVREIRDPTRGASPKASAVIRCAACRPVSLRMEPAPLGVIQPSFGCGLSSL
jgi:hypothetical protein